MTELIFSINKRPQFSYLPKSLNYNIYRSIIENSSPLFVGNGSTQRLITKFSGSQPILGNPSPLVAEAFSCSSSVAMEPADSWNSIADFTLAEIVEMENTYKELGEEAVSQLFCQHLADTFSCSPSRVGKSTITWEQVNTWFREKQESGIKQTVPALMPSNVVVDLPGKRVRRNVPTRFKKPKGDIVKHLTELAFEAKSAKDNAWYDVASFISHRVLHWGDLEVRVRFSGFKNVDDEWVNVEKAVRPRSIPLEPSECNRIKVGNPVLCFQETEYQAVYRDARVVQIKRLIHDSTYCTCSLTVRFDHDNSEREVSLESVCCRPEDECSMPKDELFPFPFMM